MSISLTAAVRRELLQHPGELVADGRALPHHVLADSGWVSRHIDGPDDVAVVVGLFALSYERAAAAQAARDADSAQQAAA